MKGRRTEQVNLRFSVSEYDRLNKQATALGVSVQSHIRQTLHMAKHPETAKHFALYVRSMMEVFE